MPRDGWNGFDWLFFGFGFSFGCGFGFHFGFGDLVRWMGFLVWVSVGFWVLGLEYLRSLRSSCACSLASLAGSEKLVVDKLHKSNPGQSPFATNTR
jgi:hypothetical protein